MSNRKIKISLDSGANIHSKKTDHVTAEDLGFDSWENWNGACDETKHNAVVDYFSMNGYPEYSWSDK